VDSLSSASELSADESLEAALVAAGVILRRGSQGSILHLDLSPAAGAGFDVDSVLRWMSTCTKLRDLRAVGFPGSAGAWQEALRPLSNLTELDLEGTAVDDRIFEVAMGLPKLKHLNVTGTAVTDAALARERRRLIRVRVVRRET